MYMLGSILLFLLREYDVFILRQVPTVLKGVLTLKKTSGLTIVANTLMQKGVSSINKWSHNGQLSCEDEQLRRSQRIGSGEPCFGVHTVSFGNARCLAQVGYNNCPLSQKVCYKVACLKKFLLVSCPRGGTNGRCNHIWLRRYTQHIVEGEGLLESLQNIHHKCWTEPLVPQKWEQ